MRSLKVILLIAACALLLLPTSKAHALLLSEGESLTAFYDFSSLSPLPPYNDVHIEFPGGSMELLPDPPGTIQFKVFDDLSDPSGSTYLSGEFSRTIAGPILGLSAALSRPSPLSSSTTQYVQVLAETGDWQVNEFPQLTMSVDGDETPAVSGSPVAEPATMLLLCTGLIGLAAYSRRKFRK